MNKKLLKGLLIVGIISSQFGINAQEELIDYNSLENENGIIRCMTMESDAIRRSQNSNLPTLEENELWLQEQIEIFKAEQLENELAGISKAAILTIPVVVHVIHNGDNVGAGENISDAQVMSQIQILNEDFRRMAGTNGFNNHIDGADVEVQFCLAINDPNGSSTNGIDRIDYGTTSFDSQSSVETMKANTYWNPDDYMNMWTCRFGGAMAGLLGYAQFPNNSGLGGLNANNGVANTDGVVAGYNYFGNTNAAPYHRGRTMTHEVGHFLGLRHIWGDASCGNDFCNDTPQSSGSNFGCPSQTTCDGNQDMVENYMDYTDDLCMNIFTNDQTTRIRTVLSVSPRRASLTTSTACSAASLNENTISYLNLYPNPSAGVFNVKIQNTIDNDFVIIVVDVTGKIVRNVDKINTSFTVDLSDLDNGVYVLNIQTSTQLISKRILVRK